MTTHIAPPGDARAGAPRPEADTPHAATKSDRSKAKARIPAPRSEATPRTRSGPTTEAALTAEQPQSPMQTVAHIQTAVRATYGSWASGTVPLPFSMGKAEVALALGVSERHLTDVMKEDASFPKPRLVGRVARWSPTAPTAWLCHVDLVPVPAAELKPVKVNGGRRVQ